MNRKIVFLSVFFVAMAIGVFAEGQVVAEAATKSSGVRALAAALAVGFGCIGGGIAVGKIGAAAMAAISENPDVAGKAIPFIGLAEGICLWGFLIGLVILLV